MRSLAFLGLLLLMLPTVSAAAEEFALPPGWAGPTHLAFDERGGLWLTLEGSWAVGRYDPETKTGAIHPLPVPRVANGNMGGLEVAPDGTVWVGTSRHLVRLHPSNGSFDQYELPGTSLVSGDIHVGADGIVWYALTSVDLLLRLDPKDGNTTQFPLPNKPFGPLEFDATPEGGFYVTATYANSYAAFDPATNGLSLGRASVAGPVGIDQAPDGMIWVAEMGASSVSRVDHATGRLERYPTTFSPYYPLSGPAGLHVRPDGTVWFIEHFADRVSRLDPEAKTLHEYQVPSTPGSNVQYLTPASDGSVWFAEFSTDRIGRATFTNEPVPSGTPSEVTVSAGGSIKIPLPTEGGLTFTAAGPAEWLNATVQDGILRVGAASDAPVTQGAEGGTPGASPQYILVSAKFGNYTAGSYIPVTITAAQSTAATPAAPLAAALALVAVLALLRRRDS